MKRTMHHLDNKVETLVSYLHLPLLATLAEKTRLYGRGTQRIDAGVQNGAAPHENGNKSPHQSRATCEIPSTGFAGHML